jgi:hypothetical protein
MTDSPYSIAWNRRRLAWYKNSERAPWQLEAILCERTSIEGRPATALSAGLAASLRTRPTAPCDRWTIERLITTNTDNKAG